MSKDAQVSDDQFLGAASQALQSSDSANNALLALIERTLSDGGGGFVSNFDGDRLNQWRLRGLCVGPDVKGFDPNEPTIINLKYFYLHRVDIENTGNGEIVPAVRCVMLDNADKATAFVSQGVAKDLADLLAFFGPGPYDPPIAIRIVQLQLKGGRRTYRIIAA